MQVAQEKEAAKAALSEAKTRVGQWELQAKSFAETQQALTALSDPAECIMRVSGRQGSGAVHMQGG